MEELTIADFIGPQLPGTRRVVDLGAHPRDLEAELDLPAGIAFERHDPADVDEGSLGEGDLLVCVVGPAEHTDADLDSPLLALRSLGPGGRFILILRGPPTAAVDDALIEALAASHSQILQFAPVVDPGSRAVAVGRRMPPASIPGTNDDPEDPLADVLRLANRVVLTSLARLQGTLAQPAPTPTDPVAQAEIRKLKRQARAADERVSALETSASYRIGRVAVDAVKQPRRIIRRLPEAIRFWNLGARRSLGGRPRTGQSPAQAQGTWLSSIRASPERLHLAYSAAEVGPRTKLVIGGILRDETAAAFGPDALIHRLSPNDGLMTLERVDPDIVLIETGAFSAGRPWAYAGSGSAVDRDRALLDVLDGSHRLGRPTVLWKSPAIPEPVGIGPLEGRFDLVVGDGQDALDLDRWHPGVQGAVFNAHDLDPTRSGAPLFVGAWDPRAAQTERELLLRLLEAAAQMGLEIRVDSRALGGVGAFPEAIRAFVRGPLDFSATAELYRARPMVIVDSLGNVDGLRRALEALACGARIVGLPNPLLAAMAGDEGAFVPAAGDPQAAIRLAVSASPLAEGALRPVARRIFETHAVPVALATLTSRLGLRNDPLEQRGIAVLIREDEQSSAMVEALRAQTYRPREVVLGVNAGSSTPDGTLSALSALGLAIRVTSEASGDHDWRTLAAGASQPWVIAWPQGWVDRPDALLDLALAAESSRAGAVGYITGSSAHFVSDLPLRGTLVRRELLSEFPPPQAADQGEPWLAPWFRRGIRLFGTTQAGGPVEP